jgi:hypothetical protein
LAAYLLLEGADGGVSDFFSGSWDGWRGSSAGKDNPRVSVELCRVETLMHPVCNTTASNKGK